MKTVVLRKTPALISLLSVLVLAACSPQPAKQNNGDQAASVSSAALSAQSVSQKDLQSATISDQELARNVEQKKMEDARKRQEELLQEAISAITETRNAIAALAKNDRKGALAAMERSIGKLDIILAREPSLELAPLESTSRVIELQAHPDTIDVVRSQAASFMADGDIQRARQLLDSLQSEIQITVLNIPLKTYPDAIRQAVKQLDQGKTAESKRTLEAALNTLVVTQHSIPIPLINAQYELEQATQELMRDKEKAKALVEDARLQIVLAEKLGYGQLFTEDYRELYRQIRDINEKLAANQQSGSMLDVLKSSLQKLKEKISL